MKHLTPEQLVDAAEESRHADAQVAAHLSACNRCRAQVGALRATMLAADAGDVPEPSPLFWEHLSARVRESVAAESIESPRWFAGAGRLVWIGGAVAALAVVVIAVALRQGRTSDVRGDLATVTAPSSAPAVDAASELVADDSWELIADLTPALDWDAADEAGIVHPGSSDRVLLELSDAERDELKRLLTIELARPGPRS